VANLTLNLFDFEWGGCYSIMQHGINPYSWKDDTKKAIKIKPKESATASLLLSTSSLLGVLFCLRIHPSVLASPYTTKVALWHLGFRERTGISQLMF